MGWVNIFSSFLQVYICTQLNGKSGKLLIVSEIFDNLSRLNYWFRAGALHSVAAPAPLK
jgi:hypothetical protein